MITGPASVDFDENATGTVAAYSALDPEAGTVALRLIGSDSDDFSFTDGVLRFDSAPNFEDPDDAGGNNTYEVTVEARDALDTATQDVTVNVTNVDEAGRLTLSSQQPQVGTELTATLTDLDGGLSGQSWTWERSPNRSSGWSTIGGASGRRYTPVDGDLNHYLRVTVTYTDGDGPDKDEQATSVNRVQAAPVVNNPPSFPTPPRNARSSRTPQPARASVRSWRRPTPTPATCPPTRSPLAMSAASPSTVPPARSGWVWTPRSTARRGTPTASR